VKNFTAIHKNPRIAPSRITLSSMLFLTLAKSLV
jgi:hypothetical protein